MPFKLSDLVQAPTEDALVATALASLSADGFPVTSWESGDVGRTLVQADVRVQLSLWDFFTKSVSNRFISLADSVWSKAIGEDYFQEVPTPEVATQGLVCLTDGASTGPHTVAANELWVVVGASGLRLNNTTTVVVPLGGSALAPVQAEHAGSSYNVSNGAITVVGSAGFPGLTVSNPAATNPASVVASGLASATSPILFQIKAGGAVSVGATTYAVSTNLGASYAPTTAIPVSGIVLVNGVTFTFAGVVSAGDSITADTVLGSPVSSVVYLSSLTSSNTWITRAGRDEEGSVSFAKRCIKKWGTRSAGATRDAYLYWAQAASNQVTKVAVRENVPATGIVTITVAGPTGAVSPSVVAEVAAYLEPKRPVTCLVVVQSAAQVTVAIVGTAYVSAANLGAAQSEVAQNFAALTNELDMGATVYAAEIVQRIMDASGVVNFAFTSPQVDLVLTTNQVAAFDTSGITWIIK